MKTLLIGVLVVALGVAATPVVAALILVGVLLPALTTQPCPPALTRTAADSASPDGTADGVADGLAAVEARAPFGLPPAGEPRRNSRTSPPLSIPPQVEALYRQAADAYQLPWSLLAGIGMEETHHGRLRATSTAGARGLMQFMPATFASYGVDGDGDGRANILSDADSINSAANYLTASGVHDGTTGVRKALFAYNHATWYVNDVLYYAHAYGGGAVPGYAPASNPDDAIASAACTVPAAAVVAGGPIPQSDRPVGSEARLTPATVIVKRAVAAMFPTITTIGGWRASSKIATSDHPHGKGLDVMIPNYRHPAQVALGDQVADYLIANHQVLKIKYLIWRQRTWTPARPSWRPMADRGSDTDNHYDHVHISVTE